ncbi:MAG: biotin/lipoyl-binding protein [Acidobacteriota bacterium]
MPGEWDEGGVTQIRAPSFVDANSILVADVDPRSRGWLRELLAGYFVVDEVDNGRTALERLTRDPPRVLVVGGYLSDVSGAVLLTHAARHGLLAPNNNGPVAFVVTENPGDRVEVDPQQVAIYYHLTPALPPERVRELIGQAIAHMPARAHVPSEDDAIRTRMILDHAKVIGAQPDLASAQQAAIAAVMQLVQADRVRCLYYDDDTNQLWSEGETASEVPASIGITGFAVRTRATVVVPFASAEGLYRREVDDPQGTGHERLIVQPVAGRDGRVHAVLIVVRGPERAPFLEEDAKRVAGLAEAWAPFIHQLALAQEAAQVLHDKEQVEEGDRELFRQEAIEHVVRRGMRGDVVRVHPAWVHAAYWMVVVSLLGAGAFMYFARVSQYAEGPAVVHVTGRSEVTAHEAGTVTSLEVAPNQEVKEGQVIARLYDNEQAARLRSLRTEFERKLVAYLQSPSAPDAKQGLSAVVAERERAEAGVEARVIRAPHEGIVKDVFVHTGQKVDAGKTIASIVDKGAEEGLSVLAFLPGSERPRLHGKQRLRLTLPSYRGARFALEVRAVSAEVLGPSDARDRYLGDRLGDSVQLHGTVVVVEARIKSPKFESEGETYELHDGMVGVAEVQLASKSVLETLLPGL